MHDKKAYTRVGAGRVITRVGNIGAAIDLGAGARCEQRAAHTANDSGAESHGVRLLLHRPLPHRFEQTNPARHRHIQTLDATRHRNLHDLVEVSPVRRRMPSPSAPTTIATGPSSFVS